LSSRIDAIVQQPPPETFEQLHGTTPEKKYPPAGTKKIDLGVSIGKLSSRELMSKFCSNQPAFWQVGRGSCPSLPGTQASSACSLSPHRV
jgi:hypothetical protein